jgi:hypothetical protein
MTTSSKDNLIWDFQLSDSLLGSKTKETSLEES